MAFKYSLQKGIAAQRLTQLNLVPSSSQSSDSSGGGGVRRAEQFGIGKGKVDDGLVWPMDAIKYGGTGTTLRTAAEGINGSRRTNSAVAGPQHVSEIPQAEIFNYIGPNGKYQLGPTGKLLPKMPKGTKMGNLVMGDYGFYDPNIKANQEHFGAQLRAGVPTHMSGKNDKVLMMFVWASLGFMMLWTARTVGCLISGNKDWPMEKK